MGDRWLDAFHDYATSGFLDVLRGLRNEGLDPIRMAVLATNAEGSPDLYLTFVKATNLQYNEGQHCDMALARAEDEGYRAPIDCLRPERRGSRHAPPRHRVHGRRDR